MTAFVSRPAVAASRKIQVSQAVNPSSPALNLIQPAYILLSSISPCGSLSILPANLASLAARVGRAFPGWDAHARICPQLTGRSGRDGISAFISEERPSHNPEFAKLNQDATRQFRMFALLSSAGFMPLAPHSIPSPGLPAHAYAQLRAITATTRYFEMFFAELNAVEESSAEVRDLKTTSFGDLPLTVLGAGRFDADPPLSDAENQQPWKETQVRQSELVALSSEGRQIMAKQSGHFI